MGVSWTKEQQQVIELRNRNILVSAAAGSGKTAVLVERILTMIMDRAHPVDIDRLLIVTFTNAAAGEMKERIRNAIGKKLAEEPGNIHLQRQLTLVHHAQITTIHSFCRHVIGNYFHTIDLDPNFRIGDDGEMKLLRNDVVEELLEDFYAKVREDRRYLKFVESYATGKNDAGLADLIFTIYDFSMSYPWPLKWLEECRRAYEIEDVQGLEHAVWMRPLLENVGLLLEECEANVRQALEICRESDGPYMYEAALLDDLVTVQECQSAGTYVEYADAFCNLGAFSRLSAKKDAAVSEEKREQVKEIREQVKKYMKSLQEQYFYQSPEAMAEDIRESREQMEVLLGLAEEFHGRFAAKKRERNLLDFNDLEHMALEILVREEDGKAAPTDAAGQFADAFEEIMIDEYQDSNLVQEYILTSVSRRQRGVHNVFMVGDVKQSIYRFRLARPELFMEKYAAYTTEESLDQKVELHKNFRSRSQVLAGVNGIFRRIMAENLGNIRYDDAAALYPGAFFPEGGGEDMDTEVLLLDLGAEEEAVEESGETAVELEARMIGQRIQELVGKTQVLDKATGKYRPAQYRDIVILLRTVSGWADTMAGILGNMGIPAYTGSRSGYFSAVEIQTVLALLKVVDNPEQDLPLTAVLHSPIVGVTDRELAQIRSCCAEGTFSEVCRKYAEEGEDEALKGKLKDFYEMLGDFRRRVPYTAMHELLWYILEKTGYGEYAAATPGGEQRRANLDMLAEKAMAYENTSYRGLFNFVRYIEQLRKYDVDYGEANILGEEEDTVRIMSIHKSKGLEFPIVFAAGMNKAFNRQDSRGKLALHPDYGIGCDFIDAELRIKAPTLLKKAIQRQFINDNLGEELRVLYVALTRAKEKLILTGAAKLENRMKKWRHFYGDTLPFGVRSEAGSYLDWVMPALLMQSQEQGFSETEAGMGIDISTPEASYAVRVLSIGDLAKEEALHQIKSRWTKETLLQWDTDCVYSEPMRIHLKAAFDAEYFWKDSMDIYGKITVSELKSMKQTADREGMYEVFTEPDVVPLLPKFVSEEQEAQGAAKGTIYHKFLENLDYSMGETVKDVGKQLARLCAEGKLTEKETEVIDVPKIVRFLRSPLGQRMKQAAAGGKLCREQQFVLGVHADEIRESWTGDDMVLVQGIIDAYFYEGDEIVLVDYKTDYVPEGRVGYLADKYGIQLEYYAQALERMTGKRVKERYIYSFWLQKVIPAGEYLTHV